MRFAGGKLIAGGVVSGLALGLPAAVQAVPQPTPAAPAKASEFTPADPNDTATFYLGLRRDDKGAITQLKRRADPKSTYYRQWLSAGETAREYGATKATVDKVQRYLKKRGITIKVDRSRVFARVSGTVKAFQDTFGVSVIEISTEDVRILQAATIPLIPKAIRAQVTDAVFASGEQITVRQSSVPAPTNQGTPRDTCQKVADNPNLMTFEQAAKAYTIDKTRARLGYGKKRGDVRPKAPKVGIVSLASGFSQSAADIAAQCLGWQSQSARVVKTDGMSTQLNEGFEGDSDL